MKFGIKTEKLKKKRQDYKLGRKDWDEVLNE